MLLIITSIMILPVTTSFTLFLLFVVNETVIPSPVRRGKAKTLSHQASVAVMLEAVASHGDAGLCYKE